jgi:hypothetical protein
LLNLILTSAGLFFLLLLFIAILLPWISFGKELGDTSGNGFKAAAGIVLFIFNLLILLGVAAAFVLSLVLIGNKIVQLLLTYGIAAAAWLGVLAFFLTLAGVFRPWGLGDFAKPYDATETKEAYHKWIGTGFGIWMAFISSLGIAGIFGFLTFQRPPELPSSNPFVRRWLLLVCILGSAAFIGLLVMIIHII